MDDVNIKKFVKQVSQQLTCGKTEPDFLEIVRRFEQLKNSRQRLGHAQKAEEEILRFAQKPYLHFPENAIAEIHEGSHNAAALLMVYFMGFCGVNGPMPLDFTSYIFQRSHNYYDLAWQRFLDIFNHRFITLFYRPWAEKEAAVWFDRPGDDNFASIMRGLAGYPSCIENPSWAGASYTRITTAPFFSSFCRSRAGFTASLQHCFQLPLEVEDRVFGTYPIPPQCHWQLGKKENGLLGVNTQAGTRYVSTTKKINIHLGPLSFRQYCRMAPGTPAFDHFCSLTAAYMNKTNRFDVIYRIRTETVPEPKLDGTIALGRSFWLGRLPGRTTEVRIEASGLFAGKHEQKQKTADDKFHCPAGQKAG